MQGFIYRISAPGSNKVYVGQTVEPDVRLWHHKSDAKCGRHINPHLGRFLVKHPDFVFCSWPVEDMNAAEIAYEEDQRTAGFDLMNMIPCGTRPPSALGRPCSEKVKMAISVANTGRKPRLGHKNTPEHTAKIAAANRGKRRKLPYVGRSTKGKPWSAARRAAQQELKHG